MPHACLCFSPFTKERGDRYNPGRETKPVSTCLRSFIGCDSAAVYRGWSRSDCRDPDAVATSGSAGVVASNVVPKSVSDATCELARELLLLDRTTAPPGEGLLSDWTSTAGKKYSKTDVRPILPRLVLSLLSKFGAPARQCGGVVKLVRA